MTRRHLWKILQLTLPFAAQAIMATAMHVLLPTLAAGVAAVGPEEAAPTDICLRILMLLPVVLLAKTVALGMTSPCAFNPNLTGIGIRQSLIVTQGKCP